MNVLDIIDPNKRILVPRGIVGICFMGIDHSVSDQGPGVLWKMDFKRLETVRMPF